MRCLRDLFLFLKISYCLFLFDGVFLKVCINFVKWGDES